MFLKLRGSEGSLNCIQLISQELLVWDSLQSDLLLVLRVAKDLSMKCLSFQVMVSTVSLMME